MKTCILFFLLLIAYFGASAQVTPIYFAGESVIADKNLANSYGVYGKLSTENLWVYKRYDLYDNLLQTGSYKDAALTIPHGKFVFYMNVATFNSLYNTNFKLGGTGRFVSQIVTFVNGVGYGRWLLFYPDGNILNSQDVINGNLQGEFVTYDRLGNVEVKGNYVDGEPDGEWIFDGGAQKVIYEKGVVKSKVSDNKVRNKGPKIDRIIYKSVTIINLPNPNRAHLGQENIQAYNLANDTHYPTLAKPTFVAVKGQFVNNLEEGLWTRYYPDGQVRSTSNYLAGKLHGEFIAYDPFGRVLAKGNYTNDIKNGDWEEEGKRVFYYKGVITDPKKVKADLPSPKQN
jgi:antitoxin component YwqK of YwqJK toxin-antitoxin module